MACLLGMFRQIIHTELLWMARAILLSSSLGSLTHLDFDCGNGSTAVADVLSISIDSHC
jgi:hypothetical protein